MSEILESDVLVIGSGIAGCTTALELADAGVDVIVVTRAREPQESNTYYAQGGIIYRGVDDSPDLLAEDITRAGAGHCNPRAVRILAKEGPEQFRRILLERVGVEFDRNADGSLSLAREGGHSQPRIAHVADYTGKAIEIALIKAVLAHPNIRLFSGHTAVDILTPSHQGLDRHSVYDRRHVVGAYVFDQENGRVRRCLAKNTVLASGGLGQIFLRTSNPEGARGDGLAMAYRAGARVINTEFIQFHPTTFHHRHAPHFLVSEAVRGAGARLCHADGDPFMQKYAPEWKDPAPRDVAARTRTARSPLAAASTTAAGSKRARPDATPGEAPTPRTRRAEGTSPSSGRSAAGGRARISSTRVTASRRSSGNAGSRARSIATRSAARRLRLPTRTWSSQSTLRSIVNSMSHMSR